MLINLSNHPISEWSEKQLQLATTQYGEVIDKSFPPIPPEADAIEVMQLALDTVNRLCSQYADFTVHIMGELTFVYLAVKEFQNRGVTCIASTSKRNATISANGEKISQFDFVRFRSYSPSINIKRP